MIKKTRKSVAWVEKIPMVTTATENRNYLTEITKWDINKVQEEIEVPCVDICIVQKENA